MRDVDTIRNTFHLTRTFAPRRSLERPAPDFPGPAAWPPRLRFSTPFHLPRILADGAAGQAPVHAPRCQRESRFSGPRRRLPTSATCFATRGHTLRAFDPRTRVELSPRCSPAPTDAGCVGLRDALPHRGPASHDLHATACARRVPLAWTRQVMGRSARVKASRALLDEIARALLVAPRAPVSPARFVSRSGEPGDSPLRPRPLSDAAPRRATPSERIEVPSAAPEPLRERRMAPPCAPGPRPRHAASWRHCSGARTPF